jgi:multiple sugar transport system permease protein/alpha-1,4-digalacturonate transport system permease protein
MRGKPSWGTLLITLGLVVGSVIMLVPLYWMFVMSFRPKTEIFNLAAPIWPSQTSLEGFRTLFESYPVLRWIENTAVVAAISSAITVSLSLLAGYAFAKLRFWGRDILFVLFLSTIMVPIQVIMVPEFFVLSWFHLLNSNWGVILPRCAEAFGIFMTRQFMLTIPDELIEAGRLDGASELGIFTRIVLPLCKPLIGVLLVFAVVWRWNDFAWPLVVFTDQAKFMLQVGLNYLKGDPNPDWNSIMALAVIALTPMLILFLFCQRLFVQGIAGTGLKQ